MASFLPPVAFERKVQGMVIDGSAIRSWNGHLNYINYPRSIEQISGSIEKYEHAAGCPRRQQISK
jgi:hypothetical protein